MIGYTPRLCVTSLDMLSVLTYVSPPMCVLTIRLPVSSTSDVKCLYIRLPTHVCHI